MSQIAALALKDSGSVERTFDVQVKDGLTAEYVYQDGSPLASTPKVTASIRRSAPGVSRKVNIKVVTPFIITNPDGSTTTKFASMHMTSIVPDDTPVATIDNLVAFAADSFTESQLTDIVKLGAFPY